MQEKEQANLEIRQEKFFGSIWALLWASVGLKNKKDKKCTISLGLSIRFEYHTHIGDNQEIYYTSPFLQTLSRNVNKASESLCMTSQWTQLYFPW